MNPKTKLPVHDLKNADQKKLASVLEFSKKHLGEIYRRSGESYAEHCVEVAAVLGEASADPQLLSVALLHDLPVHPDAKDLLPQAPVSAHEMQLIEKMHALRRLHINESTDDLDTVIDAFIEEPELLLLRMAHRVNDVRNIGRFRASLQRDIARETLHMYSAIAGRLGMQRWRAELEDVSFPIVQPKIAAKLQMQFDAKKRLDAMCLKHASQYVKEELTKRGITAETVTRIKGSYSTYRKMVLKRRAFDDLTDRLAIRILVEDVEKCYLALGVVHAVMHPIPGKLKDYIGAPKENGYRSIHTVVYPLPGVSEQPIEIQIRTPAMHRHCEFGPASHEEYKQSMYALVRKTSRVNLFRNLQSLREEARTPKQFEDALRMYFREDHIMVFDEENTLYHLKGPATAVDFACLVHPKKWSRIKQVRINGRKQPLGTPLQDGDTIDLRFSRERQTKKEWINASFHKATRNLLQNELRKEESKISH